jgi:NAD(P)-dependent dehydrogenase (short-subunit alcohol dehydrogenase family)
MQQPSMTKRPDMTTSLTGRTALVTGAGTIGMGRAIGLGLAAAGATVCFHYFGAPDIAEAASRQAGGGAIALGADLSDPAAARRLVTDTIAALGRLDALVYSAGTLRRTPILEVSDAEWDYLHAVNLRGAFATAQEAARHMVARGGGGRIVIVSSVNQVTVNRGLVHYAATKGGLMQLAKGLALELAEHRITVNLIAPGTIETDLNRAVLADPEIRRKRLPTIPAGRFGQPEDAVGAALFLLGDGADYVTGATITVDGGLTIA